MEIGLHRWIPPGETTKRWSIQATLGRQNLQSKHFLWFSFIQGNTAPSPVLLVHLDSEWLLAWPSSWAAARTGQNWAQNNVHSHVPVWGTSQLVAFSPGRKECNSTLGSLLLPMSPLSLPLSLAQQTACPEKARAWEPSQQYTSSSSQKTSWTRAFLPALHSSARPPSPLWTLQMVTSCNMTRDAVVPERWATGLCPWSPHCHVRAWSEAPPEPGLLQSLSALHTVNLLAFHRKLSAKAPWTSSSDVLGNEQCGVRQWMPVVRGSPTFFPWCLECRKCRWVVGKS